MTTRDAWSETPRSPEIATEPHDAFTEPVAVRSTRDPGDPSAGPAAGQDQIPGDHGVSAETDAIRPAASSTRLGFRSAARLAASWPLFVIAAGLALSAFWTLGLLWLIYTVLRWAVS